MKKLNKKGFTLIELLAVIVVLAVIMLVAVTAVVPMMNRSKKQAFITEATTIIEGAEAYFTYQEMTGGTATCVQINMLNSGGKKIQIGTTVGSTTTYKDITAKDAILGEYVEAKGKDKYVGKVEKSGDTYTIHITNGNGYYIMSTDTALATAGEGAVTESAPSGFNELCSTNKVPES